MQKPEIPTNESDRLVALDRYKILDTLPEQVYDDLTQLAADICGTPIALISLVDKDRQWFKSRVGIDATETPRDISFCGHAVAESAILNVPDARLDPRFADNPLVTEAPKIRFYAGVPLITDDNFALGTLCVIDRQPHDLTEQQIRQLEALSRLVISQLELRLKEESLRILASVVESSVDAIITKTVEGIITSWNPAAERLFGYSEAEAIGQPISMLIPPDRLDEEPQMVARIMREERVEHFETVRISKEGKRIEVSATISPLVNDAGQVVGASTILRDISDRKLAELELWQVNQLQRTILDSTDYAIISTDLNGIIQTFNDGAEKMFGYSMGEVVGQVTPAIFHDAQEVSDKIAKVSKILGKDIGVGFEALKCMAIEGLLDEEWINIRKDGSSFPISISVTVLKNDQEQPIGFLSVRKDISDRKRAEKVIKQQFASIEAAIDGIAILQDNNYIYLNKSHLEIFGYQHPEELVGRSWKELYSSEEISRFEQEVFPVLMQNHSWQGEAIATRKDGSTFNEELSLTINEDGFLICVCRDISDRKLAEQELSQVNQMQRAILDGTDYAIISTDLAGIIQTFNAGAEKMFGYSMGEVVGNFTPEIFFDAQELSDKITTASKILGKDIGVGVEALKYMVIEGLIDEEWIHIRKDGSSFPVSLSVTVLKEDNGQIIGFVGFTKDISDQKQAEKALKESEQSYASLMAAAPVGIFRTDAMGHCTYVNDRWCRISGLTLESAIGDGWRQGLYSEDRESITDEWYRSVKEDRPFSLEYRFQRPDGVLTWVYGQSVVKLDADGIVTGYVGTITDISDRKQAEQTILQQANREILLRGITQRIRQSLDLSIIFDTACQEIR